MALYDFKCKDCGKSYDSFASYDETEEYPSVNCPKCGSGSKKKIPSLVSLGRTSSKMDNFGYRAGYNMERAQGERRFAEENSHMGTDVFDPIDDMHLGEGIHENENAADDAWL